MINFELFRVQDSNFHDEITRLMAFKKLTTRYIERDHKEPRDSYLKLPKQ